MRQRTVLAHNLMEDRCIALLDERILHSTRAHVQEFAAEVLADKAVLLVTHDPAEAVRLGHQIIVLTPEAALPWPTPQDAPISDQYAPETLGARCLKKG